MVYINNILIVGMDLPFWWGLEELMGPFHKEQRLSKAMVKAFIDFASLDPKKITLNTTIGGFEGSPEWPRYLYPNSKRIELSIPIESMKIINDDSTDEMCYFFDGIIARMQKEGSTLTTLTLPTAEELDPKNWIRPKSDGPFVKIIKLLNRFIHGHFY
jgi:hypothetical protein